MNWFLVAAVAVLILLVILGYNGLVRLRNEADTALSGIDVQLKRRADLIPNLVETVKGYAAHESSVLEAVTRARSATLDAHDLAAMEAADRQMEQAVGQLIALGEAYPDLKASANFETLQGELSDTEDKVAAARRYYNAVVQRLNTRVESIPTNILARIFGFARREFFRVDDDSERQPAAVSFSGTP